MKYRITVIVALCSLSLGCAAFSGQARMEQYGRTLDAYETAMRMSDFNTICKFVEPSAMSRQDCLNRFGAVKLVDYQMTAMQVSDDRLNVDQEIEVGYYSLNRYVLKKIRYEQSWHYLEERQEWFLENGPPSFK